MTAALCVTPLYGAKSSEPLCFLLTLGGAKILLDCGWDEQFDVALLQPVLRVLPQVDLVLLSHPDTQHLGALPYLVGKAGLKAPIYAAAAVAKLGPLFMYDHHTSLHAVADFDVFGHEDVDAAFDAITVIKHLQMLKVEIKQQTLRLVGYPAGHMVGGTVWVIEAGREVIVYGVGTNHNKERHLNGGQLASVPSRAACILIDAPAAHSKELKRGTRERALEEAVLGVLRRQGNVLMPVDTAGRMLEMLLLLDRMWHRSDPKLPYPLALLSPVASSALHAARGLLEWMSDELQKEFNTTCVNPLTCKNVLMCHSLADISRLPPGPKVVLASGFNLEHGMARQLMLQWAADARNAVLLTQQPRAGTLASKLLTPRAALGPMQLSLTVGKRVKLEGAELEAYEAKRAEAEVDGADGDMDAFGAEGGLLPLRESSGAISQLKRSSTGQMHQVLVADESADVFGTNAMQDEGVLREGFAAPGNAMYSMFPDEQELLEQEWDSYGQAVDTSELRQNEESLDISMAAAEEEDLEDEDIPTKVVQEQVDLTFAAQVTLLDGWSGVSDGRSLCTFVAGLAPRALVIAGGSAADTADMATACAKELPKQQTQIYTPGDGEDVQLPLAPSYPITISNPLLRGLSLHQLGMYQVAWLDGQLDKLAGTVATEDSTAAEQAAAADATVFGSGSSTDDEEPKLVLLPAGGATATGLVLTASTAQATDEADAEIAGLKAMDEDINDSQRGSADNNNAAAAEPDVVACGDHGGIFIGNVKLSEVKQALAAAGIPSEFRGGGRLVAAGVLVVRRDGPEGQLIMEGPLCADYFRVRDVVYSQYNVC